MIDDAEIEQAYERWKEAHGHALTMHEIWIATLKGRGTFLRSAIPKGIGGDEANTMYTELREQTRKEYAEAFSEMCKRADEYVAALRGGPPVGGA